MTRELRIDGMHCTACADSIERYLVSQPGVTDASVSYDDGRGEVTVEPAAEIERLVDEIDRMGYDVRLLDAE